MFGLHKLLANYGSDGRHELFVFFPQKDVDISNIAALTPQLSMRLDGGAVRSIVDKIPPQNLYCVCSFNGRTYFGPRNFERGDTGSIVQLQGGEFSDVVDIASLYGKLASACEAKGVPEADISFFVFEGAWLDETRHQVVVAVSGILKKKTKPKDSPAFYCTAAADGFALVEKPWGEMIIPSGGLEFYLHPVTMWLKRVVRPAGGASESPETIYLRDDKSSDSPPGDKGVSGLENGVALFFDDDTESALEIDFKQYPPFHRSLSREQLLKSGAFATVAPPPPDS